MNNPRDTREASISGATSAAHRPADSAVSTEDVADGDGQAQAGAVTVWDGFARFATTPVVTPPGPGAPARSLAERLAYHSQFVTVRTPAIDMLATQVRALMLLGRHQQVTARPSLIVTGPAGAGKTTALLQVGRACHLARRRRQGESAAGGQVPVAYVLVPPAASAKTLALEFARYLGIPATARMSQAQVVNSVCHTYTQVGVRLVMIDEIHRLNPRTTTGAQSADLLKDLTERIGATFVYAGIDVTSTPLFTGVRGEQLAARASLVDCDSFPAREGEHEPFKDLVRALENALDLRHHRSGSLVRLAPYLHARTAGRIGSLARLVKQAALAALLDGTERITRVTLEAVRLDHLAEQHYRPRVPTRSGSR
ncbi:ATP/GTP-binding protein [Streptomyces kanamyceticus]|uniref:ATP/GTP-binding protein n=1 Tax=Streptomyces kanamyceticus TaxID=1967 RepID=A0A5J6GUT2_STRKN|nr:ATP/GTP-binding protein [Streptomyces kanamyceticus]